MMNAAGTNNYFLRVICRKYSVSRLTCGDWVLSKTQILQVVLMKLQKMWSLKTLHIVVGYFLVWQVIKTLPPPPPPRLFNNCEIRNKLFFKAWQEKKIK